MNALQVLQVLHSPSAKCSKKEEVPAHAVFVHGSLYEWLALGSSLASITQH